MSAELKAADFKTLKLDLGCGKSPREGFLGVDRRKFDGVEGITDLTKGTWLFDTDDLLPGHMIQVGVQWKLPNDCVDEVNCSHFLEHLNHNSDSPERCRFMNELYRVMVKGGKATITTPAWCSNRAYGDFTHADKPVTEMFYFYLKKEWRDVNAPDNDIEWNPDGYSCDFEATWGYNLHPLIIPRNQEYQMHALTFWKEAAQDIIATLIKI